MASTSGHGPLNPPEGGDNVTSKTVAPYGCNHIIRAPQVEIIYERRRRKGREERKGDIIKDDHKRCEAMDYLIVDALIYMKESKPWLRMASLVEASTSKAYESNESSLNDCKASTSKAYEPNDCKAECKGKQSSSKKETSDNAITKSPKQEKRRRWYPQKSSRAYRLVTDFGDKLINCDIRVWWPIDQQFFRGTIVEFDPQSKRHTIHYLDDDVETLDLTKECWHFADLEKLNPILELETYQGPPPPRPKSGGSRKRRRH